MVPIANIALLLEQQRLRAWNLGRTPENDSSGTTGASVDPSGNTVSNPPRVLVIGPESSGKTALCKTLANYAVRTLPGWTPILVNLDTRDVSTPHFTPLESITQ
jgi:polyribonucleotide 5'-hydroxyl-kinase